MELEVAPSWRLIFDNAFNVRMKVKPARSTRGKWAPRPTLHISKGIYNSVCCENKFGRLHQELVDAIDEKVTSLPNLDVHVPSTFAEAKQLPQWPLWRDAINEEISVHESVNTYLICPRPRSADVDNSDWEFSIEDNGKYRAKLRIAYLRELDGQDYKVTSSGYPKKYLMRLFFSIVAQHNLSVEHMKFNSAYFNRELPNDTYIEPPLGLREMIGPNKVLRLKKHLHGMAQAPLGQSFAISKTLRTQGFFETENGSSLFHRGSHSNLVIIAVFHEDLLIASRNQTKIDDVVDKLQFQFKMRNLGVPRKLYGVNIEYHNSYLKLHVGDYIDSLLRDYDMVNYAPMKIPAGNIDLNLYQNQQYESCSLEKYRSLVAKLLYASTTVRLDIEYIVRELVRYLENPKQKHWDTALNVVRYLKGTKLDGIRYKTFKSGTNLAAYTSSRVGQREGDIYLGYVLTYSGAPIHWRSKMGENLTRKNHQTAIREVASVGSMTSLYLKSLGFAVTCQVYSDDQDAIDEVKKTIHELQPKDTSRSRKRGHHEEVDNGSMMPVISVSYLDIANPSLVLSGKLPYESHKDCCRMLHLEE